MRFSRNLVVLALFAVAATLTVGCGDKADDKKDDKKADVKKVDNAENVTQVSFDVTGMS